MPWRAPLPDEHLHPQALLLTMLRWCAIVVPVGTALYGVIYWQQPTWPTLGIIAVSALTWAVTLWSLPRVRRGQLHAAARALLALFLLLVLLCTLSLDDRLRPAAMLGFPCVVLVAASLESPSMALAWSGGAIASVLASLLLPRLGVGLTKIAVPGWLLPFFDAATIEMFVLVVLLSRATTRHLRETLAASEEDRVALEGSNAQLERQRAELQTAEAHLSELATSLDRSHGELHRFAHAVSHGLLGPLRVLESDSVALQQTCAAQLDDSGREHLAGIAESAHHMDALVTGLLTYSTVALPRAEVEAVEVGPLVERVAGALDLRKRADFTMSAGAPVVHAHRMRLEQIFANLLENAVKFQRPGVRPAVAVEWADRGDAWELSVRDNGIGIEPRHFDKLFGLFQRLHLQSEYEGTGIGLAIVRKAVEEHGGKVWVESTPGQGSVFRFTLPRPGTPAPEKAPPPSEVPPVQEVERRGLGELALPEEGRRLAHGLVTAATAGTLLLSPLPLVAYLLDFFRRPSGVTLLPALGVLAMGSVSAWGLVRVRRGDVMLPARVLMGVMMAAIAEHLLHREEVVLPSGSTGLALVLVFSTSVERSSRVIGWLWGAGALYAATMVARSVWPMRSMELGPVAYEAIRFNPLILLGALTVFSQVSIRYFRKAVVRSRATRSDLALAHDTLERHKAQLLAAQAHLSAVTTRLARSNRELQSFTYVASHDLRAPLRALTHYSRFLQEDCAEQLDELGRAYLQRIAEGARHLDALVADLLEYSRIGRARLEPEWVDTRELVEHVVGALRLRERAEVTVAPDLPAVWGLRQRLEQVFSRLVENAAKYGREGVRPAIAVEWVDRPEAWELAVRDNGVGIEEKDRELIFGLFQRLRPRGWYDGTGMGLPIARKAVEEHGGKLWVESSPGQGSVFRFTLPKPVGASAGAQRKVAM